MVLISRLCDAPAAHQPRAAFLCRVDSMLVNTNNSEKTPKPAILSFLLSIFKLYIDLGGTVNQTPPLSGEHLHLQRIQLLLQNKSRGFYTFKEIKFTQKWKFCHCLHTFMSFQTHKTLVLKHKLGFLRGFCSSTGSPCNQRSEDPKKGHRTIEI